MRSTLWSSMRIAAFVYLVSHDDPSAYAPADRFTLMRVPKGRIAKRDAYEFFVQQDEHDEPVWTRDINNRGAVFEHQDACYRSGISYNAGLKRYVWCQIIPSENLAFAGRKGDMRFHGGFGVYDAPEPWGHGRLRTSPRIGTSDPAKPAVFLPNG